MATTYHFEVVHRHDPFIQVLFLIDGNGQLLPHDDRFGFAQDMVQDGSVKLLLLNRCGCSRGRGGRIRLGFGSHGGGSRIGSLSIGSLLSAPVQELLKGVGHFGSEGVWLSSVPTGVARSVAELYTMIIQPDVCLVNRKSSAI